MQYNNENRNKRSWRCTRWQNSTAFYSRTGPVWVCRRPCHWLLFLSARNLVSLHLPPSCSGEETSSNQSAEPRRIQPSNAIPLTSAPWHEDADIYPCSSSSSSSHLLLLHICHIFFLFLVYCVASRQSLHVSPWKPFCLLSIFLHYLPFALCFSICLFFPLAFFISFPRCLSLPSFLLPRSLPRLLLDAGEELLLSPSRDKSRVLSRRHSVRGFVAEADEISGAHLAALYGDLLGWDEQQASHHSPPNRLPSCMCLFLLQWQEQRHCQGWSRPPRPAACRRKPRPALRIITFY